MTLQWLGDIGWQDMAEVRLDKFKNLSLGVPASAFAFMKFSWVFATFQQSRMKDHREGGWGSPSWGAHWPSCLRITEDKKWLGGSLNSGKYLLRRQTTKILGSHTLKSHVLLVFCPAMLHSAKTKAYRRAFRQEGHMLSSASLWKHSFLPNSLSSSTHWKLCSNYAKFSETIHRPHVVKIPNSKIMKSNGSTGHGRAHL